MLAEPTPDVAVRAALYRALGDERRLQIIDALQHSDRSPGELAELTGLDTNLLAFHLDVLEEAALIDRTASSGDARRRYVTLNRARLDVLTVPAPLPMPAEAVLFICTANSARSQLAAQLWHARTSRRALSAGTAPADRVAAGAIEVARRHGLDLSTEVPRTYAALDVKPDLVISVCDRAHESQPDLPAPRLHWSIPDPVGGGAAAFDTAFQEIAVRIDRLAAAVTPRASAT